MSLRMYNFRLYPSRVQQQRLFKQFDVCKQIYNNLLELNINTYKQTKKGLSKFAFNKIIKDKYPELHSQVAQNVSDRLSKALQNFFRRAKDPKCRKKGFPRFKSQVRSITFPQSGFKLLSDKCLRLSKVGSLPIVLHRAPKGKIKTLTIKHNQANQWFAIFSNEIEEKPIMHPNSDKAIGIDVGLETFATLNNGEAIANPRFLRKSEAKLKRLQRQMSRKVKGSKNRAKARFTIAKMHIKIENQRADFLHKESRKLVTRFGKIAVEKLNIQNMMQNHRLAKSIADASWNRWTQMLSYKAVASGGEVIKVSAKGTTSQCRCGHWVKMPLSKRVFHCPSCGFKMHRDLKAAISIHDRAGLARISTPVDIGPIQPAHPAASSMDEAGTTYGK